MIGLAFMMGLLMAPPTEPVITTTTQVTLIAPAKGKATTWHCTAPKPLEVDWTATVRTCGWE